MKKIITITAASLVLLSTGVSAQWGGMPFGSSGSNMMPWGQSQAPVYQQPQSQMFGGMMPFGGNSVPQYRAPQSNGFGSMMPWGGGSQPQFQQPQSQGFMMPGMDQGIRSMMQPGKIMAEEATPGMYMKPTWR